MHIKTASDYRALIRKIQADTSLSPSEIARIAGLAESTVTRAMHPEYDGVPRRSTIAKIERQFGEHAERALELREDSTPFDHALHAEAQALGLDPDAIARKAVEHAVKRKRIDAWIEDNRKAMEANAQDVRENGLWSDGYRAF